QGGGDGGVCKFHGDSFQWWCSFNAPCAVEVYRSKVTLVTTCVGRHGVACARRCNKLRTGYGIPEPGRTAHAARVAVLVAHEARGDLVGEHMARPAPRHFAVERLDVRHAAAQHDDVRVEDIDHAGERAREALHIAFE